LENRIGESITSDQSDLKKDSLVGQTPNNIYDAKISINQLFPFAVVFKFAVFSTMPLFHFESLRR
jgi:hypothetical protein